MAFDRIEPPDLWLSTIAKLLFRLVCLWTTGKTRPRFEDFLPPQPKEVEVMDEEQILRAFGFKPDDVRS